jgi:hypothetical protein
MNQQRQMVLSMGQFLGEEVLRVRDRAVDEAVVHRLKKRR